MVINAYKWALLGMVATALLRITSAGPAVSTELQVVLTVGYAIFVLASALHWYKRYKSEEYDTLSALFGREKSVVSFSIDTTEINDIR